MKPLIVNHPEPMMKVRVITLRDAAEKTLKTLHKIGAMHIEEAKELKPADRAAIESEKKEVAELLGFATSILSYLPARELSLSAETFEVTYAKPLKEIGAEVRLLHAKVASLKERLEKVAREIEETTRLIKYLTLLAAQGARRLNDLNYRGAYLVSKVFVLSQDAFKDAEKKLNRYLLGSTAVSAEGEVVLHAVFATADEKPLESLIAEIGGRALDIPAEDAGIDEFIKTGETKLAELRSKMAELRAELEEKTGEDYERIFLVREALAAESERLSVLEKAAEARYVTLVEGWVPARQVEDVFSGIRGEVPYVFVDGRPPGDDEQPPTKLNNSTVTKPFEVIVNLFGTPMYREWDPTPIVAYSFAFFFGIMTCDFVYGLGVIFLAKFLLGKFVDDPHTEGFKAFQKLLYISGGVASVLGLLSGSYLGDIYKFFGIESLAVVGIIEQTFSNPMSFIIFAVVVGLVHVNMAYVIALVKAVKGRNLGVILGRVGILILQICAIPLIMRSIFGVNIPLLTGQAYSVLTIVMIPSILLIIVGAILESPVLGVLMWIFNITGVLGDVMSYSRLAGVGLASFYLASSFNMIAGLFRSMIPGVAGLIFGNLLALGILLLGHVLNLFMGTIGGFVHSLRLCFLEFLSKFYDGGGTEYSPFKLRMRTAGLIYKGKA
ncbi:MAG: V-type ATPase 116kDa subunit family protein [Chloroflexota bacterium]